MSRGLGKIEKAVLEIMASHPGGLRTHAIAREMSGKHFRLGPAYDTPAERAGITRALTSLCRKGYLWKHPGPYGWYDLASKRENYFLARAGKR